MGLPGAGKSTLTDELSGWLGWPVLSIGSFRREQPPDRVGEAQAWEAFYEAIVGNGCSDVIVETSGLNGRLARLDEEAPRDRRVRIKLVCRRELLHERVEDRDEGKAPEPWAYSASIPDRHVFIDRFHETMERLPADIKVDTGKHGAQAVFGIVSQEVERILDAS